MRRYLLVLLVTLGTLARVDADSPSHEATDRVVLLDGTALEDQVTQIDHTGQIHLHRHPQPVRLDNLRYLTRAEVSPSASQVQTIAVTLIDGSRIVAKDIAATDERLQVTWEYSDDLDLPLEMVRSARLDQRLSADEYQAAVTAKDKDRDTFFVIMDDQSKKIEGFLEELTAERITFEWQKKIHKLPRDKLQAFVLAAVEDPPENEGRCRLDLADGSSLWAVIASMSKGTLRVQFSGETSASLPWTTVRRMTFRSPRMAFLSDLEPTSSLHESVVTLERPWQRDLSVDGRPLKLGNRPFEKGLGVHARSVLRFDAQRKYDFFAATIGIDAETSGRGDCLFIVRGDGRELYRQRVRGADGPRDIRLDIQGVGQLTLVVEPGDELDLGDHADWCDARLIKKPAGS